MALLAKEKTDIGARIRKARLAKKMTIRALERATGIDRGSLSAYEHGHHVPGIAVMSSIADALGVTIDRLYRPHPKVRRTVNSTDGVVTAVDE